MSLKAIMIKDKSKQNLPYKTGVLIVAGMRPGARIWEGFCLVEFNGCELTVLIKCHHTIPV